MIVPVLLAVAAGFLVGWLVRDVIATRPRVGEIDTSRRRR